MTCFVRRFPFVAFLLRWTLPVAAVHCVCIALLSGCSASAPRRTDAPSRVTHDEALTVKVLPAPNESVFRVVLAAIDAQKLSGASGADVLIEGGDSAAKRFPLTITSMGAPGRAETVSTSAFADIPADLLRGATQMKLVAVIGGREHLYEAIVDVDTSALALLPQVARSDDSGYVFTLRATRRRTVPGEYFPSSEQLRISVVNMKGATVWSSDQGLAFLTVVMPVEPEQMGATYVYQQEWNGITIDGESLPPGRYRVVFLLPVRPLPYSQTLDITVPLR